MRPFKPYIRRPLLLLIILFVCFGVQSCKSDKKNPTSDAINSADLGKENVIEVITEAMEFQMADTINSGWNTWRYHNQSTQTHFILIDNYPQGVTLDTIKQRVLPVFGDVITLINEGKSEEGFAEFAKMPKWFADVKWPGGIGLISPGHTAETTLKLEPGRYFVECYVKMNTGMWHTNMGMIKEIVVVEERSNLEEPLADVAINISSKSGIEFEAPTNTGTYRFSVNFLDQVTHEHFLGHDVNLVKIEDNADVKVLEAWMDWRDPKGLIEPSPAGFTFLGGVNDMPGGSKGYFTANLELGKYALISEVPSASEKNMLKIFEVSK